MTSFNHQLFRLFLVIISVLNTNQILAEEIPEKDWFQIEYVLFEHLDSDRDVLRYEDILYMPEEKRQYQYLYEWGQPLSDFHTAPLDAEKSELKNAVRQLAKSKSTLVHAQGAWQQIIDKENETLPLKIQSGVRYENNRYEIEGTLTIKRSRYLHAMIDIYKSEFVTLPYEDIKDWYFESEELRWPATWLFYPLNNQPFVMYTKGFSLVEKNVIHLQDSRRIKDAEMHYIDHPALGMIITIKRIDDPTAILLETEFAE